MNTVRFGIIGCGMISRWHKYAITHNVNSALVGVTDAFPANAEKAASEWNVECFKSADELLSSPYIDAVSICTPSGKHAEYAIKAAEHGKHVLIEKPLALTPEDCDRVINAANEHGVKISVVSQLRFCKQVGYVKELLGAGKLGKILTCELSMRYYRAPEYYNNSGWHGTWALDGGGSLMNQGIHGVDLMLYLMGKVVRISGSADTLFHKIETEDTAAGTLLFESGAVGTVVSSTASYPGYPRTLRITGTLGTVTLTEDKITELSYDGSDFHIEDKTKICGSGAADNIDYEGHTAQVYDFADAILNNKSPAVTAQDGASAVRLVYGLYKSAGIR